MNYLFIDQEERGYSLSISYYVTPLLHEKHEEVFVFTKVKDWFEYTLNITYQSMNEFHLLKEHCKYTPDIKRLIIFDRMPSIGKYDLGIFKDNPNIKLIVITKWLETNDFDYDYVHAYNTTCPKERDFMYENTLHKTMKGKDKKDIIDKFYKNFTDYKGYYNCVMICHDNKWECKELRRYKYPMIRIRMMPLGVLVINDRIDNGISKLKDKYDQDKELDHIINMFKSCKIPEPKDPLPLNIKCIYDQETALMQRLYPEKFKWKTLSVKI